MEHPGNTANWPEEDEVAVQDFLEATVDPNVSMSVMTEEVPTLTVATIVGVTVVMLVAIVIVFLLGVLVDCRQQRLIEKKIGEAKRSKNQRRVNTHPEDDNASIANNAEEIGMSMPPAEVILNIP